MRNPLFLTGMLLVIVACNQPETSSFYISGVVDRSPARVMDDLNALPTSIGLTKDRYWRQHGSVLLSEKRTLANDSGETAGSFKDDIQTYWSPAGEDKGKLAINIGIRAVNARTEIHISTGGAHTRVERVPRNTMRRLASWLKNKYGAESFTACENAFC
jgi:hypothetical protein